MRGNQTWRKCMMIFERFSCFPWKYVFGLIVSWPLVFCFKAFSAWKSSEIRPCSESFLSSAICAAATGRGLVGGKAWQKFSWRKFRKNCFRQTFRWDFYVYIYIYTSYILYTCWVRCWVLCKVGMCVMCSSDCTHCTQPTKGSSIPAASRHPKRPGQRFTGVAAKQHLSLGDPEMFRRLKPGVKWSWWTKFPQGEKKVEMMLHQNTTCFLFMPNNISYVIFDIPWDACCVPWLHFWVGDRPKPSIFTVWEGEHPNICLEPNWATFFGGLTFHFIGQIFTNMGQLGSS